MSSGSVGRVLAWCQFALSLLIILGFFGALWLVAFKKLDISIAREVSPFVGIVVFFWFQRQRPQSADDPPVDPSKSFPTQPPAAANPPIGAKP